MSGWTIKCCDGKCAQETWAGNIDDLIKFHSNDQGWFSCKACGNAGFIERSFKLQEPGETWKPYLKGIIRLGLPEDTYQPFVFLVSYEPNEEPVDVWFSYYKDTRSTGGKLKMGYGPGGPPVLGADQLVKLIKFLIERGCLDKSKVLKALDT